MITGLPFALSSWVIGNSLCLVSVRRLLFAPKGRIRAAISVWSQQVVLFWGGKLDFTLNILNTLLKNT